jgi:hypothetical protein
LSPFRSYEIFCRFPPRKAMLPSALPPLKSPMSCQTNHREN